MVKKKESETPRAPRYKTPMQTSEQAVEKLADLLVGIGFPRHIAYQNIAVQLHRCLVDLKAAQVVTTAQTILERRTKGGK